MAKRLTDNVNSSYIEAANRLKPKHKKRRVVAYVESYDDVLFWRSVLEEFESPELHFEVMLPSRTTLAKGKKLAMSHVTGANVFAKSPSVEQQGLYDERPLDTANSLQEGRSALAFGKSETEGGLSPQKSSVEASETSPLGPCLIACVDADYDYLMQGHTENSQKMLENPYIFHTYVYAIENYQCYAPSLHSACVMATLNDRELIDFEEFIRQFSVIVWPLLVWSVWLYRHDHYKSFSIMDMANEIGFRDINIYHPEQTLEYVRRHVNKAVSWMQRTFPAARKDYEPLREEMLSLGLTPETTYLYIQGHTLFDNIVLPLLSPVCTVLRRERENEIKRLACHEKQRQNELSCYQHSVSPIDVMLKKGTMFRQSEPYSRLREDLRKFVEQL